VVEITAEAARYPGTRKISVGQEFVSAAEASRAMGVLFNLTALEFSKVRKQEKEKGIDPTGRATARGVVFEYCFRP
jgi:hypothetical protein